MRSSTLAIALLCLLAGCQSVMVEKPLTDGLSGSSAEQRSEFWYQLARIPVTSNDDAAHALLLFVDGKDDAQDYAARMETLRAHGIIERAFEGESREAVRRGDLACTLTSILNIRGGLSMHLLGNRERYAIRALEFRGLYPPSSPQQTISGSEFVGILARAEDYHRGYQGNAPAMLLPSEAVSDESPAPEQASVDVPEFGASDDAVTSPIMLTMLADPTTTLTSGLTTAPAATAPAVDLAPPPGDLEIVITGIEGDETQVRESEKDPWQAAALQMRLKTGAELRVGKGSAIRFTIGSNHTFTLDRQTTAKILRADSDGKTVHTDVGLLQGRIRQDLEHDGAALERKRAAAKRLEQDDKKYPVEQSGVEFNSIIRSPNSALAVRGTRVSITDEPPFAPEATSLTGRATFQNTRRKLVAFGGAKKATVRGSQTAAAEQALDTSILVHSREMAATDFEQLQITSVLSRGGRVIGDVLIGNSSISDQKLPSIVPADSLSFVLRWDGGALRDFHDLNLAVISPLDSNASPDFVANPPFIVSLQPNEPVSIKTRANEFPRTSRSGGRIGGNHIGPEGLEIATWPASYTPGSWGINVYNLLKASPPPTALVDPVTSYRLDVFVNKTNVFSQSFGPLGVGQARGVLVAVPPASVLPAASPSTTTQQKTTKLATARRRK